jgi:hypothetical protein
MARSYILETFAASIGFYAFNRWALKHGLSLEATRAVIRNTPKAWC